MRALLSFSRELAAGSPIEDVLHLLAVRSALALQVAGAGVALVDDGLIWVAASIDRSMAAIEDAQAKAQQGPAMDAVRAGSLVRVSDLRQLRDRWPHFTSQALEMGVVAVMSVPLRHAAANLGALDLYATSGRDWPNDEITIAQTLASIAAAYLSYASELERSRQVTKQLHQALTWQIVVEQAKGMIAVDRQIPVDDALGVIRQHAVSHQASMHDVAEAIVGLGLRPL
jgi:GAF domain-containing protein